MSCYIDTSALAKWYLPEPNSAAFESFILEIDDPVISRLTICEMRCLLARRRRAGDYDADFELTAWATFLEDTISGALRVVSLEDSCMIAATDLIGGLEGVSLRTLDALHLATALHEGIGALASADVVMLRAAGSLGLAVHDFS